MRIPLPPWASDEAWAKREQQIRRDRSFREALLLLSVVLILVIVIVVICGCGTLSRVGGYIIDGVVQEQVEKRVPALVEKTIGAFFVRYLPHSLGGLSGILGLLLVWVRGKQKKAEKTNGKTGQDFVALVRKLATEGKESDAEE